MRTVLLLALPALCLAQLGGMPGGISDTQGLSMTAEPVRYAVGKINEMMTQSNGGTPANLQLQEIVKARTQVVSGQKLYLTLHLTGDYYCDVNVWYQAWNKSGERCTITKGPDCHRKPQAAPRVGGVITGGVSGAMTIDKDTAQDILDSLKFGACAYNDQSNAMFSSSLGDVSGVTYTKQVVAGMRYTFHNVPMTETTCQKNGACDQDLLTNCAANVHGMRQTCTFSVVFAAWQTPKMSLADMSCQ